MPVITDDFTGANGTAMNGRTPSGGGSEVWTADSAWTIDGNRCERDGAGTNYCHIDCGSADKEVEFTLVNPGGNTGMLLRYVDDNNWLGAYVINTYVHIVQMVAGVLNDPAFSGWEAAGQAIAANDVITVTAEDVSGTETQVVLSVNGTPAIDKTSSGGQLNPTGTRAGFFCTGAVVALYDDLTITPLGVSPPPPAAPPFFEVSYPQFRW